jgi:hypothetical protein
MKIGKMKPLLTIVFYAAVLIAACDWALFHFKLISFLIGEDINRAELKLFGRTLPAQILYILILSVIASALGFAWRKKGTGKENLLFSVFYGLIALLLPAYLVAVYLV